MMLRLLFIYAIFTFAAAQNQNRTNCNALYYTVNTRRFSSYVSCYEVNSDCDVYYAPPGTGCNEIIANEIITIPKGDSDYVYFNDDGFNFGGGFCSSELIGAYEERPFAYLPTAADAGTDFHIPLVVQGKQIVYQCSIFSLVLPAKVRIAINDDVDVRFLNLDPFEGYELQITSRDYFSTVTMINSDNPIIVSCLTDSQPVTLQPMSSQRLLLTAQQDDYVAVAISDCLTKELIQDFSKVKLTTGVDIDTEGNTEPTRLDTAEMQILTLDSPYWALVVEPLDNICVSAIGFPDRGNTLSVVGVPESKFSTRFVSDADVEIAGLFSFTETSCYASNSESKEFSFNLTRMWNPSRVQFVNFTFLPSGYSFECIDPFLPMTTSGYTRQFVSDYEPDEILCSQIEPDSPDSRSLVSCSMNWVTFFGFYLFSSSLILK